LERVKPRRRLVGKDQRGVPHELTPECEAAALAARDSSLPRRANAALAAVQKVQLAEHIRDTFAPCRFGSPCEA
jgi:hypothetical protein